MSNLFTKEPAPIERVTVRKGECVSMFAIVDSVVIERDLVDEQGNPCNSVGGPLPVGGTKVKKKRNPPVAARVGRGEVGHGEG